MKDSSIWRLDLAAQTLLAITEVYYENATLVESAKRGSAHQNDAEQVSRNLPGSQLSCETKSAVLFSV